VEWVESLHGQVVGLDTAPLVYFIEENPTYLDMVQPFFAAMDRGEFQVVTSVVTLLEVLIHPLRLRDSRLAEQYRDILLGADNLTTLPLSSDLAETAAEIRAAHNVRTPDAIQMAAAMQGQASLLLTNDSRLPSIPDLRVLVLDNLT